MALRCLDTYIREIPLKFIFIVICLLLTTNILVPLSYIRVPISIEYLPEEIYIIIIMIIIFVFEIYPEPFMSRIIADRKKAKWEQKKGQKEMQKMLLGNKIKSKTKS